MARVGLVIVPLRRRRILPLLSGVGVATAVAAAALLGVGAAPAAASVIRADVDDFTFESFDAQYYLSAEDDGAARLRVVETIVAEFPDFDQNRGIVREVPRFYQDVPLGVDVTSVTDAAGNDVPWEEETNDEYLSLALGTDDYVYGEQTYVIEYEANDVVRNFADSGGDEFYWDINGTEWAQPFGAVTATVHVDPALTDSLTGEARCYVGGYGSEEECDIQQGSATIVIPGQSAQPGQTLSFAVGFDGGTFVQPELAKDSWIVQIAPWVLTVLVALIAIAALAIRFRFLGNAPGKGIVIPQYSVPRDLDPLLAGLIVDRVKPSMPAQFLSLAVNGMVTVVDRSPESGANDSEYDLVAVTTDGATPRELEVMRALFGDVITPGEKVSVDKLGSTVGARLHALYAGAGVESIRRGLRGTPTVPHKRNILIAGGILIALHVLIVVFTAVSDAISWKPVTFGIISLALYGFSYVILTPPQRLNAKGAELKEYLLGVRDYLDLAEKDRMRVLQSPDGALRGQTDDHGAILTLHEKLLPFAVLFGVEREWSKQLEFDYEAAHQAPSWTDSPLDARRIGFLVGGISAGSNRFVQPISSSSGSSWTSGSGSSFSSGSSGGGFAGGGGGGGGGGGR